MLRGSRQDTYTTAVAGALTRALRCTTRSACRETLCHPVGKELRLGSSTVDISNVTHETEGRAKRSVRPVVISQAHAHELQHSRHVLLKVDGWNKSATALLKILTLAAEG